MTINFENALGIHADALQFRSRRAEVIANNLSNSATPEFKARDIRFSDVLAQETVSPIRLTRTSERHFDASTASTEDQLYRTPLQPSADGNTVEAELEEANYMRNALEFQSSFTFLNGRFRGLTSAIRGE
ncbi:MAG: flagellar basal body rod protein FlgB [Pseudomonadales bacterium]|nr:flagellar basal body rod protein FlgB [Pseudomonadales bacterium]